MTGIVNAIYTLFHWNKTSVHVGVATIERCLPFGGCGLKDMGHINYNLTQTKHGTALERVRTVYGKWKYELLK